MHPNDSKWINFVNIEGYACSVRFFHIESIVRIPQSATNNFTGKWIITTDSGTEYSTYQNIDELIGA